VTRQGQINSHTFDEQTKNYADPKNNCFRGCKFYSIPLKFNGFVRRLFNLIQRDASISEIKKGQETLI